MLQTINFSNEFDFKAIQEYIERIPQVKRLNGQSVKINNQPTKVGGLFNLIIVD